ncbi:MAG: ABC transporter ATP-binding protein [Aerococcaceae bacterium]|nr:ABC transporter ATP-binding protein [Aerococcaceae bacterium]
MTHTQRTAPLIDIRNVNKYYQMGENRLHVLKDVNLTIEKGEFVSIMGPSGSGKSTLINVLGFLDNNFDGVYHFNGQPLEQRTDKQISQLRNQMVGFVFQDFNLIPTMTVSENVRLPLIYNGYSARQTKPLVQKALDRVGLGDKGNHKPSELSGGQKQRVAIARALINNPSFIIADEPTGALDTKTSRMIMEILSTLHAEEGVTIVMVTHNPEQQKYATRHIVIVDGEMQDNTATNAADLTCQFNKTYEKEESFVMGNAHTNEEVSHAN